MQYRIRPFLLKVGIRVRIKSIVTDRYYEQEEMVFITNPTQIAKYLKSGAVMYDLLESNGSLVAAFSKKETKELYAKWQRREL